MSSSARCTLCCGFLEHAFISANGIDVYRCTRENEWNDNGRYFIQTGRGLVEVTPRRRKKNDWYYEIVDKERRRKLEEQEFINRELEERRKVFIASQQLIESRFKRDDDL